MRSSGLTHQRAKALRGAMTAPELLLWVRLRGRAPDRPTFRRQHPLGPYVLDFYCSKARLAVEVDGQSHDLGDRPAHDVARTRYLESHGVRVLRYRAGEVMADPNGVANAIVDAARGLVSSCPLSQLR